MNRRQLAFLVLINAVVSLVVALAVVLAFERRRPDLEELAAIYTPLPQPILAATTVPNIVAAEPTAVAIAPPSLDIAETPTTFSEEEKIYVVQAGDSLLAIATSHNISVDDIVQANKLANPDFVFSGQRLIIPAKNGASTEGDQLPTNTETPSPEVQTVEISAVEDAGNLAGEAILVVNESSIAVNLQGWRLARDGGPTYNFGNVPLFPGGSVRVYSGTGLDSTIDLYWGQSEAVWPSGSMARLFNVEGDEIGKYSIP